MTDPADRLRAALASIAHDWNRTLIPVRHGTEGHTLTSHVNAPPPISASTLDVRATALERCAYWTIVVTRGRQLHRTGPAGIHALCGFLTTHAQWLAASPSGSKALAELESSAAKLAEIAHDSAPKRMQVGPCPGTNNGKPCAGIVKATVRQSDDQLPSEIRCDATPSHAWPSGVWRTLERQMHMNEKAARRLAAAIVHVT